MLPASLMQVLQFWVPRDEELERAIVGSIRAPFLFLDFDRDSEAITARILSKLARFENVDDLGEATLTRILINDALRDRLEAAQSGEADEELVESAVIDEAHRLEAALNEESARRVEAEARLAAELADLEIARAALSEEVSQQGTLLEAEQKASLSNRAIIAQKDSAIADLEDRLDATQKAANDTETRLALIEQAASERSVREELGSFRRSCLIAAVVLVAAAIGAIFAFGSTSVPRWVAVGASIAIATGLWFIVAELVGSRLKTLANTPFIRFLRKARIWLWGVIGALALGVLSNVMVLSSTPATPGSPGTSSVPPPSIETPTTSR